MFLGDIKFEKERFRKKYPFNLSCFKNVKSISLKSNVTFFVGENGSGKSTLLENIAFLCGYNVLGGSKNHLTGKVSDNLELSDAMRLSWKLKPKHGFFFRAESYFNFASYIDEIAKDDKSIWDAYGGKSLHHQSHGESFLTLFQTRFCNIKGFYILDEPEAALSPQRQLTFLKIINDLDKSGKAQFIIATHSPIVLAYPKANIFSLDNDKISRISYEETEHYQLTKNFMENPERYFRHLF